MNSFAEGSLPSQKRCPLWHYTPSEKGFPIWKGDFSTLPVTPQWLKMTSPWPKLNKQWSLYLHLPGYESINITNYFSFFFTLVNYDHIHDNQQLFEVFLNENFVQLYVHIYQRWSVVSPSPVNIIFYINVHPTLWIIFV